MATGGGVGGVEVFRTESAFLRLLPAVVHSTQTAPLLPVEFLLDPFGGNDDLSLLHSLYVFEFNT